MSAPKDAAESTERVLRHALEAIDRAVCVTSPEGSITFANEAFCRTQGWARRDDAIGRQLGPLPAFRAVPLTSRRGEVVAVIRVARELTEQLRDEIVRAERFERSLSFAIIEIDSGDPMTLRMVLEGLRGVLRATDRIEDWDHQTVAVLMPETDFTAAVREVERLREVVHHIAPCLVGVSSFCPGADASTLLCGAQDALWAARERENNRINRQLAA